MHTSRPLHTFSFRSRLFSVSRLQLYISTSSLHLLLRAFSIAPDGHDTAQRRLTHLTVLHRAKLTTTTLSRSLLCTLNHTTVRYPTSSPPAALSMSREPCTSLADGEVATRCEVEQKMEATKKEKKELESDNRVLSEQFQTISVQQ